MLRGRARWWPSAFLVGIAAFVHREVLAGRVLLTRDLVLYFIPDIAYLRSQLRAGHLPLWHALLHAGQPFLATMQAEALYPPRLLATLLFDPVRAASVQQVIMLALAGPFAYGLARTLGMRRVAATFSGLTWVGGGLLAGLASQQNVVGAVTAVPASLWAARVLGSGWSPRRLAGVALAALLVLLAGSPETFFWAAPVTLLAAADRGGQPRPHLAAGRQLARTSGDYLQRRSRPDEKFGQRSAELAERPGRLRD